MRPFIYILITLFGVASACSPNLYKKQRSYFPEVVKEMYFGMSYTEWQTIIQRDLPNQEREYEFRMAFIDDSPSEGIGYVVYYFDNEGDFPLYEMIINYDEVSVRDAWIEENLGSPNFGDGEWLYDSGLGYQLNLWTFQNKLVIAAAIAGCEWDENGDGIVDQPVE